MGFEVRAETGWVWGEGDHAPEVFLDAVPEDEEGWGGDVGGVGWERGVHGSGEFEDPFDFSGDVAWERAGAEGAAGTDAEFLAEDGGEEFGAAIDDLGVVVEVGGGVDEAEELDDAFDAVERAEFSAERGEHGETDLAGGGVAFFEGEV